MTRAESVARRFLAQGPGPYPQDYREGWEQIRDADAERLGIPSYVLSFDGINAPEGGVFLSRREVGSVNLGDVVPNPFGGPPVVVITHKKGDEYVATKFHNAPRMPIAARRPPWVQYQIRIKQLPWPYGKDRDAKTVILQFGGGGTYEYSPTREQLEQTVMVKSRKYGDIEVDIGYSLSHGMLAEGLAALKALKIPFKKLEPAVASVKTAQKWLKYKVVAWIEGDPEHLDNEGTVELWAGDQLATSFSRIDSIEVYSR